MKRITTLGQKKVLFVHNPKTGGQAIYKTLGQQMRRPHTSLREVQTTLANADLAFTVVRHPFARSLSTYHWLRTLRYRGAQRVPSNAMMSLWTGSVDANQFFEGVALDWSWARAYSPMFSHQWSFTRVSESEPAPDKLRVLRFESLQKDFDKVCDECGARRVKLGRVNASVKHDWRKELSASTRRILRGEYAKDFELFYPDYKEDE